ncbi:SAM-dependent methyltransferase [Neobacillus sedimentimangrovi]|uniref:SAM-dependent methyltransferase n=1 Tax=Neobacillus sedimentimangrovi TaxID=2699460 RepID=A0ABS8QFW1_9BACI|nr:SAM-dependent methyltransferase [Neobacillus sedimentimangrovi]MCD4838129.1 SAM-dependent methyltransferase [Neobacillus sedimentimangrovi]
MISYIHQLITNSPNQLITYADFIYASLYHPKFGYYMKDRQKIGKQGDFITTSNISDIYGRQIAKWASAIYQKTGLPAVFCEIGAGNGRFAEAFLREWEECSNVPLKYYLVETSPYHREQQRELLRNNPAIVQFESLKEMGPIEGIVFSNELFDALPVHVIEKHDDRLFEVMIGIDENGLYEKKIPLSNRSILTFLQESGITLMDNQRIEVPLAMENLLFDISQNLISGLVVTADYGYTNEEWMDLRRMDGSLRGYFQHKMVGNILQNPGEMDITTHIHFDSFIQKGEKVDLQFVTKLRQDEFLIKTGILQELENHYDPNPFSEISKRNRAIRSLIMPSGISSFFHIIIQQKQLTVSEEQLFNIK